MLLVRLQTMPNESTGFFSGLANKIVKIGNLKSQIFNYQEEVKAFKNDNEKSLTSIEKIIESIEDHPAMKRSSMASFFKGDKVSTLKKSFNQWKINNQNSIDQVKLDDEKRVKKESETLVGNATKAVSEAVETITNIFTKKN